MGDERKIAVIPYIRGAAHCVQMRCAADGRATYRIYGIHGLGRDVVTVSASSAGRLRSPCGKAKESALVVFAVLESDVLDCTRDLICASDRTATRVANPTQEFSQNF